MALECEVTLELDERDLAAILTKEFCERYGAFSELRVEFVRMLDDNRTFQISMTPKPEEPDTSA